MKKAKLSILKSKTYQLRAYGQIPYALTYLIYQLTEEDDVNYLELLMALSERYLRVKGYYKRYKQEEEIAKQEIILALEKMGYQDKVSNI